MTTDAARASARPPRRFPLFRIFLWGGASLLLLAAAGLASLYLICVHKPDLVATAVQQRLAEATGMPWRIRGAIRPVLAPLPGLVLSDVHLAAATTEQSACADPALPLARVDSVGLYADLASLLEAAPRLHLIELINPVVNLAHDARRRPLWLPPPGGGAARQSDGGTAEALKLAADAILSLPAAAVRRVIVRNGSLTRYSGDGGPLLSLTGIDGSFDPSAAEDNLHLDTVFALPEANFEARLSLSARVGREGVPARGRIWGELKMTPPGSRALSGEFASGFVWQDDGRRLLLPDFRMLAETDSLTAELTADLAAPECTGRVWIHKLSLPRWFEFGRVLPPGLRQTLDGLVGEFELRLDPNRAEARNLRGIAGPLAVSGHVGAPDLDAPVVVVDLDVDRADLDLIFPFLAKVGAFVPDPVPPVFDHPPLAPYPDDPDAPPPAPGAPPGIDVGYDVKVRVARPRVHAVEGGPLAVLVFPASVKGAEKTRVTFTAPSLLEGSVDGRLDIDERSIAMHYDARDLELRLLPENADNTVRIAGKLSGVCEIDVPMLRDSALADEWKIRVNAAIRDCDITGRYADAPWRLFAGTARADGEGEIYTVRSRGIRIEGLWNVAASGMRTSWFPRGNDGVAGTFEGGLHWAPVADAPRTGKKELRTREKRGVDRVAGRVRLEGSLMTPFGSLRKPVAGKMGADLDWRLYGESVALRNVEYAGFGSYLTGGADIDFSGKELTVASGVNFTLNPRALFQGWRIPVSKAALPPKLFAGTAELSGKNGSLRFDKIRADVDGAPVTGEISWQAGAKKADPGLWTFRLSADSLDLDKYFPPDPPAPPGKRPPPPSKTAWDLSWMKGLAVDAQVFLANAKKDKLAFRRTKLTAALRRDRFSLYAESAAFYGGKATFVLQGAAAPEQSRITLRKGLLQIEKADIGALLQDYNQETSFGGRASLLVDAAGSMSCDADIPAQLSGVWNLNIDEGLYPAFMGGEESALRNTFSSASAGGALEKGVLRSGNFSLTGAMVDMKGGGWFDLAAKDYDMELSVTFAKVPTVPMRFHGSTYAPRMQVRGVDMVVETVQNAGSTVFGMLKGVLLLPAHAVYGISRLIDNGAGARQPPRTAPLAPMKHQTGHPGQ